MVLGTLAAAWAKEKLAKHGAQLALVVVLGIGLVLSHLYTYKMGKDEAREEYAAKVLSLYEKELAVQAREKAVETAEAAAAARDTEALENRVERQLGALQGAITRAGTKPTCDLTDEELAAFEELNGG